jgi:choline dehydrogenase
LPDEYDYVVVGAGRRLPAGQSTVRQPGPPRTAARSRRPRQLPWIHIPVGYLFCIGNPRTDWCFKTEAQPGLQGRA